MNARPTLWLLALMAVPVAAAETESPSAEEPTVLDPVIVEGEQTPLPTLRLSPPYPPAARHRWTEGCVLLQFTVREDGKTDAFTVLESKPRGVFERSVIRAVLEWEYAPQDRPRTVTEEFVFEHPMLAVAPTYRARASGTKYKKVATAEGGQSVKGFAQFQLEGRKLPSCKQET